MGGSVLRTYGPVKETRCTVAAVLAWGMPAKRRAKATVRKSRAAQELVKKRWTKTTAEERAEIARKLNAARWAKRQSSG